MAGSAMTYQPADSRASIILAYGLLLFAQVANCQTTHPAQVPDTLIPPSDAVLKVKLSAKGVQIYQCQGTEWKFQGPEAQLFDGDGHQIGKHFAGPTWESTDGSSVVGELSAHADGPDPSAIAWLLLSAKSNSGHGLFSDVRHIQRLQTVGGRAPSASCTAANANQIERVPYTANYYFYALK